MTRILEGVMPLRIIREVEKWPVLYKRDSQMIDPNIKYKVWEEVAKNVIENYEMFTAEEKQSKVTGLMKKWRNMRDTFNRHLKLEKFNREGHDNRRRQYVHFKYMSFLLPHMIDDEAQGTAREGRGQSSHPRRQRRAHVGRNRRQVSKAEAPSSSSISAIEHMDADQHFLLSLLPSFKRLSEDQKRTAKMEILKIIDDVKNTYTALDTFVADDTVMPAGKQLDDDKAMEVKDELLAADMSECKWTSETCSEHPT